MSKVSDHETVKQIMNEVYNKFYLKWRKDFTQENAAIMIQEARALSDKYNCDLCRNMVVDLMVCIQDEWIRRQGSE